MRAFGGDSPGVARRAARGVALLVLFAASPLATAFRATFVERAESVHLGRPAGSVLPVVVADLPLVGLVLCLASAGWLLPATGTVRRVLAVLARLLAILLLLVQAVDAAFLGSLLMRLQLADVALYAREVKAGLSLAAGLQRPFGGALPPGVLVAALLALLLGWIGLLLSSPFPREASTALKRGTAVLSLLSAAAALVPADARRFHGWAYPNVIAANRPKTTTTPYSAGTLEEAKRRRPPERRAPGLGLRRSVVLWVVESLSTKHSAALGGIGDLTPQLDALAARGLSVPAFLANGMNTNMGLVALLTGRVPLPSVGDGLADGLAGFLDGPTLPKALAAKGYFTEFLSTADLGFTRQGEWLRAIGFESIRGSRDPAFDGWPRLTFDSAPDEALVNAAAARIGELRGAGGRPFLLVVMTSTSHMPFVHPNGRDHGEAGVFRYVDGQVGRLAALLASDGFLDSGLLLVTGDHRTMEPLERAEEERFGLSAFTRVPFVAVGAGVAPRRVEEPFQQADVPGSLLCLLTEACTTSPFRGNLFADPPLPPRCVVSPTGNDRSLAYARCGNDEAFLRLDGDASRVVRGRLRPVDEAAVLGEIARVRLENEPRPWPPKAP